MPQNSKSRVKRLFRSAGKVAAGLFALALVLAILAYKNVIPGGPELMETIEHGKNIVRRRSFANEAAAIPKGAIVFVGSSSAAAFPINVYFPNKPVINRGLNAELAEHLKFRVQSSLPDAEPAGIVLWTGMNDLRADAQPPEEVALRVERVLDNIYAKFPRANVVIIDLPPQVDSDPQSILRLQDTNQRLKVLAEKRGAVFLNTDRPPITNSSGQLSAVMARPDRKHYNFAAYGLLAKWLIEDGGAVGKALAPASSQ
ncbi:MAG: hypothetical protein IPK82_15595 [Polyangiaceae bacterium]|nr:hypothetical protein [Polyangiaceae bacterium]